MIEKNIIQFGNIAGLPYYYSKSLRKIGINSISIKLLEEECVGGYPGGVSLKNRKLPSDISLCKAGDSLILKRIRKYSFFIKTLFSSNLIHYHGATLLKYAYDAFIFSKMKMPMIISWAGGEARIVEKARKNNPYFYRENNFEHDKKIITNLKIISKYIKYVATDPEMSAYSMPYFEKVFILKQPIDLNEIYFSLPNKNNTKPIIMHIPTHQEVKGTKYIERAIERLKDEGFSLDYLRIEPKLTQTETRRLIATCDIYVDELRCGSYGVTAVEAMASGKPTITYIREDLLEKYPKELPIVNANPDTIYNKLKELIKDAELRLEIGINSRSYVEKHHSLEVIGPRLIEIYKEIGYRG